jgi:hypothetical protein
MPIGVIFTKKKFQPQAGLPFIGFDPPPKPLPGELMPGLLPALVLLLLLLAFFASTRVA